MDDLLLEPGSTSVLTLNRPDRANSVTPELTHRMFDVLEELDSDDDVRAVILTGAGRFFCSGADLTVLHEVYADRGLPAVVDYLNDEWMPAVQRAFRRLWDLDKPTVAAVNGPATAGGCDLALLCDYRVASAGARFGETYVNLGILPVAGGAALVPRIAGGAGRVLLLSGELIDAATSLRHGLVDEVTELDPLRRAREITAVFESRPVEVLAAYKRAIRRPYSDGLADAMAHALEENRRLHQLPEVQSALTRTLERFGVKRSTMNAEERG